MNLSSKFIEKDKKIFYVFGTLKYNFGITSTT